MILITMKNQFDFYWNGFSLFNLLVFLLKLFFFFNFTLWLNWVSILILMNFGCLRAGELSAIELDSVMTVVANPRQFKIPDWFLNRKKDYKDGKYSQVVSNALDMKLRDDLERLKKIRWFIVVFVSWCWILIELN